MAPILEMGMTESTPAPKDESFRRALAWGVHFYTATGLIAAAAIAAMLTGANTGPNEFRWAFVFMFIATLIDATDGTLARWVNVKKMVPGFDGRRLDDLIDFLTYTCLPLLLIWRAELIPSGSAAWLLAPLLASAYGFCQVEAKTEDGFFLGFPSYWNLVAFYLYLLQWPLWLNLTLILFLAALTFVPIRYLYPTHRGKLNRLTLQLGAVWSIFPLWILFNMPGDGSLPEAPPSQSLRIAVLLSLAYPIYYFVLSWTISLRIWRRARRNASVRAHPASSNS